MGAVLSMRLLVTRPEPDAQSTLGRLAALGIEAVATPVLHFRTLSTSLPPAAGFGAVALSSANGLRALEERGHAQAFRHLPVFTVGERTARAAREAGFEQVWSADGGMAELATLLASHQPEGPVFYPCARQVSGDLPRSLAPFGIMVVAARLYDMEAATQLPDTIVTQLREGALGGALLYSRRSAEIFVHLLKEKLGPMERRRLAMLCLSETVAEPLLQAQFGRISLADWPSEDAMMSLALAVVRDGAAR